AGRMPQRVLRGGKPRAGVGAEQGQCPESSFDRAAQAVVDNDPVKAGQIGASDLLTGDRVTYPGGPSIRHRYDDAAIGALEEPSVAQSLKDRDCTRIAQCAERGDRLFLFGEAAAAKTSDQGREIIRPSRQCPREEDDKYRGES